MFKSFMKRTNQSSAVVPLEAVEIFNGLFRERAEVMAKVDTLTRGLERAEARLAEIPKEEKDIRDDHYRAHVKRELDPSLPDRTDLTTQQLKSLADERGDLQGKVSAYGEELASIHRVLGKLNGEVGAVEQARRTAWAAIAEMLIKEVSPDFKAQFIRIWSALDRVSNGMPVGTVMSRLVSTELRTDLKMQALDALRCEFGILNEYQ